MFETPEASARRAAEDADLQHRFGEYWKHTEYWDGPKLYKSAIACAKMLLEMGQESYGSPSPNKIGAVRSAGEMFLRLLNKHMPDLKAIEMSGSTGMTQEDAIELLAAGIRATEQAGAAISAVRGDMPPHSDKGGVH